MTVEDGVLGLVARAKVLKINPYDYVPTEWICILFVVLFSISTALHTGQAVWYRLWWLLITPCVAGILEIVGWTGRLWSSQNPYLEEPYFMQIVCTIIGPTPFIAANFVILGQLIRRLGPCYSRLSAKMYTWVFCGCDVISLVAQALGGAVASHAVSQSKNPSKGAHIMLAGIVFQMASITFYMILATEFILRYIYDRPARPSEKRTTGYTIDRKMLLMLIGLAFSSICIYIRSVYRTIELADGFRGYIITTERFFNWLDGGMVTLAMYMMNILHPGHLLGPGPAWTGDIPMETLESSKASGRSTDVLATRIGGAYGRGQPDVKRGAAYV